MTRSCQAPAILLTFPLAFLTGCTGVALHRTGTPAGRFRHPLFNSYPMAAPARRAAIPFLTTGGKSSPPGDCRGNFSHPLLNFCQPVVHPRSSVSGPSVTPGSIAKGLEVAALARENLSRPRYRVGRRSFRRDCSGFVLSILAQAGYDVDQFQVAGPGGGAATLFRALQSKGLVHRHKVPMVGDLVFFDNTYDRNRDGLANDELTHVGLVERVDPDGTVTFIHRVRRGPLRYRLNLFFPHRRRDARGKRLNHVLRLGAKKHGSGASLTGELFHAFATVPH